MASHLQSKQNNKITCLRLKSSVVPTSNPPPIHPNSSTKHNINNTKVTVAKIATSDGQSYRELQVDSNRLSEL